MGHRWGGFWFIVIVVLGILPQIYLMEKDNTPTRREILLSIEKEVKELKEIVTESYTIKE